MRTLQEGSQSSQRQEKQSGENSEKESRGQMEERTGSVDAPLLS